jgi:hypothetical protein
LPWGQDRLDRISALFSAAFHGVIDARDHVFDGRGGFSLIEIAFSFSYILKHI